MKVSTLRESMTMASPSPRELEEELMVAGSEPGDLQAKPPVKPKPRTLPAKPALPAKPSLLVPVGPRPPRGPLAELPSARKMNMLAGPQPYGGSKRPLPFATRSAAEAAPGGEARDTGKEEAGKEELPPTTPPARCAAPAGVRKAPAPFRPTSERFAATTVEEILAKMEQPRKEAPASPDRLWGSRLTFNHDGSSRYGPRTYGIASSASLEDGGTLSKTLSQEGPTASPSESLEGYNKTPEKKSLTSDQTFNGDLAYPQASSGPPSNDSKPCVPTSPSPAAENGGSPSPNSLEDRAWHHAQCPEPQSPAASPHHPSTPASPAATLTLGSASPALGDPKSSSPSHGEVEEVTAEVSRRESPELPPVNSPRPLMEEAEGLHLTRTLPSGAEAPAGDLRPTSLAQRRFSEGVLQPPAQDPEKLGGSLAALPQSQGSQLALDRPFGSGTESNWSLSQSFEWTFPSKSSGLGARWMDSPPPSPITEATEAAEAAAEAADWVASQQRCGTRSAPEGSGQPCSGVQAEDKGCSLTQKSHRESQPLSPATSPGLALLQAEERCEQRGPMAGQESPLPEASREAALPVLEPLLGQQQPAPSDQPCVLFADSPNPGLALPAEEEPVALVQAKTTQPGMEPPDSSRVSPEPTGPANDSRWLDDLLASPPPLSTDGARQAAGPKPEDLRMPDHCSEGLLGWSRKDLQKEFGIATETPPRSMSPPSWAQDTSQDYDLGASSPPGDPGLTERDWSSPCRPGIGEGSTTRDWASGHGISQEEQEVDHGLGNGCGVSELGGLATQDQAMRTPALLSQEAASQQDWEFTKRGAQATFSTCNMELHNKEFGKRDSTGTYSSRDTSLQDWEFEKKEPLGVYGGTDAGQQSPEHGRDDRQARYRSQETREQDWEFGKRQPSLGPEGSLGPDQPDPDFGNNAWMGDYGGSSSSTGTLGSQERNFGLRALSAGFSPEDAQQQDEEFEKKGPSGADSPSQPPHRQASQAGETEAGGLFSSSNPPSQAGTPGQREQSSWQGSGTSLDGGGWQGQVGLGSQNPSQADQEVGEMGTRGWASDFRHSVTSQSEAVFGPGQQAWSGEFSLESPSTAAERSHQFGIIGNDWASGAGPRPSDEIGGSPFASPEKPSAGPVDWTDQLGLRNLEVPSCVVSGGSHQAREDAAGPMGWSDTLGLASQLGSGGPEEEPRGVGVGEKDWTCSGGGRGLELQGVEEIGVHGQVRESGVGQTGWSGVEAGEFLKSRERGVGQADWTPSLGLSDLSPGPRESGAGQVDWSDNLGLRNLEVPCDPDSEGSQAPRGCGVGQMDWTQDLEPQHMEASGAPSETREHGVGEVSQPIEPALRSNGALSPDPETRDPLEARELGVEETCGAETQGREDPLPGLETQPEDSTMETGNASNLGNGPGARSPPSGSQDLLEEMLAASREAAASRLRGLSEEAGAMVDAAPTESPLTSWRPQPDGEASRTEEVDGTWGPSRAELDQQGPTQPPRRSLQGPPPSSLSQDFDFIEDTEILDSAMYRSRASLGRKRGHRAPAIRPGGTLGLSEAADSDARLFRDSTGTDPTEPRASRVPSSDEEVVEEPQNRRTRMSLGTKGLKVNLFPGLSPSALKAKLRPRNRSAEEGEPVESKPHQKESAVQRSKSCKVPGLGKPLALPPKPEKSSGSESSSPNWLQALKLKKKKV